MSVANDELRVARLTARNAVQRAGRLDFKPISSAKWVDVTRDWNGKLHVHVEHDTIRGVTPQMMRWWFENQARKTTWNGTDFSGPEVSFYHLWHHRDHISILPKDKDLPGFKVGHWTRLMEQFNDFHEIIDVNAITNRLDDEAFIFTVKWFRFLSVCQVLHFYSEAQNGTDFHAETVVGVNIPIIGPLINWCIVPFIYSKTTAENWIRHNIEETGRSEDVVPPLYRREKDKLK